jgi:hypothetical protein
MTAESLHFEYFGGGGQWPMHVFSHVPVIYSVGPQMNNNCLCYFSTTLGTALRFNFRHTFMG